MNGSITAKRIKKHLVIKIPLEEVEERVEKTEDDVLRLADKGLKEHAAGKSENFTEFVSRKYPHYNKTLNMPAL